VAFPVARTGRARAARPSPRRSSAVLGLTVALFTLHACELATDSCACSVAISLAGHYAGTSVSRDSLDFTLAHTPGELVFSGTGRLFPSTASGGSARPITIAGSIDPATYELRRMTIYGWFAEPAEFRTAASSGHDYMGHLRLPPGILAGDTLQLFLKRVGP
jgi:hypothetical protein